MFAISVELLTGRYIATAFNDRSRGEWPPHPARLFSAFVAAWAAEEGAAHERAALEWLEALDAPEILADAPSVVAERSEHDVFVPVNDVTVVGRKEASALETAPALTKSALAEAVAVMPSTRGRQPRRFPVMVPCTPRVTFSWPAADCPAELLAILKAIASRTTRLGHSASLVHVTIPDEAAARAASEGTSRYVPDADAGELMLRWVRPGQVVALVDAYTRHREVEPRVLPRRDVAYRVGAWAAPEDVLGGVFDSELIVLARVNGPRLPITATVGVTSLLRRALMAASPQPVPATISGHEPDGAPVSVPHIAFLPMPRVGGVHADGSLLGLALALPRDPIARTDALIALRALAAQSADGDIHLMLGPAGELVVRHDPWGPPPLATLRPENWTRPSRRWASVTPVALDRNPGDLHDPDPARRRAAFEHATATILAAIEHIGLPVPARVDVVRSAVMPGSAKPRTFPRFPVESHKAQRVLVHVRLEFDAPVVGPVVIGAGRYLGLGLCAPVGN
jgi:CRISPR-associated protein Csb2